MMKRLAMLAGVLVTVAGCGSSSPSQPSAPPNTIVFTATLNAANEVPPITNADSNAKGTATITFHLTRDSAGTITAATVDFLYNLSDFPAGTVIRATHIHEGAPSIAGGVVIDSLLTPASAITLGSGAMNGIAFSNLSSFTGGLTLINQIIANPNGYYFNVHSNLNPGGAVRGQLVKQP